MCVVCVFFIKEKLHCRCEEDDGKLLLFDEIVFFR